MIALRPRDQHVWDPRAETSTSWDRAETKTNYCETETETETKKVVSRPRWSRDLNIHDFFEDLEFDFDIEVFNFDFDLDLNFQGETHVSVIKNHECRY